MVVIVCTTYLDGLYILNWSTTFGGWLVERGTEIEVKSGRAYAKTSRGILSEYADLLELLPIVD